MFPFFLRPFFNFWINAAQSGAHPNQKVEQSLRLRGTQRAAPLGWRRGRNNEGHVKKWESAIKSNASFLVQLRHRVYFFCFAFFIDMKGRTQTNASFLLCFMLESHFPPPILLLLWKKVSRLSPMPTVLSNTSSPWLHIRIPREALKYPCAQDIPQATVYHQSIQWWDPRLFKVPRG